MVLLFDNQSVMAADEGAKALTASSANGRIAEGVGLKGFDGSFVKFVQAILDLTKPIIYSLTAIAGLQIAFGINDGTKTVWNWILGVGLAYSFADVVYTHFFANLPVEGTSYTQAPAEIKINGTEPTDILSNLMKHFKEGVVLKGAEAIKPICLKLMLILFTINCSLKLALDLISGDKIKFLISEALRGGFYAFLIINWIGGNFDLTGALSNGFQELGFIAGGASGDSELKPDSIWSNGIVMIKLMMAQSISITSVAHPGELLLAIVIIVVMAAVILMISLEMFMVRIEFLVMALLTMPLLAFGVIDQFKVFSEKAISAVFNLSIKCCCIAFIQAFSIPFITNITTEFRNYKKEQLGGAFDSFMEGHWLDAINKVGDYAILGPTDIMYYLQMLLALLIIFFMTKKIPALIQGLLSGTPQLGGGDMRQMAMSAMRSAASGAGRIKGAVAKTNVQVGGGAGGGSLPPRGGGAAAGGPSNSGVMLSSLKSGVKGAALTFATGGAGGAAVAAKGAAGTAGKAAAQGAAKSAASGAAGSTGATAAPAQGSAKIGSGTPSSMPGNIESSKSSASTDPYHSTGSQSNQAPEEKGPNLYNPEITNASAPQQRQGPSYGVRLAKNLATEAMMASPVGDIVRAFRSGANGVHQDYDQAQKSSMSGLQSQFTQAQQHQFARKVTNHNQRKE